MASVAGGSFASPSADAQTAFFTSNKSIVSRFIDGLSAWNIVLTFVLGLVVYDQSTTKSNDPRVRNADQAISSQLHMAEGLYSRAINENALHWSLS